MGIAYGTTTLHQATKGIVQDGLVLNLDAGVRDSYDSGTTWRDLKGSNNGALTNMSASNFISDNGGSFSFDGSNESVTVTSNNLSFNVQSGSSFLAWVKPDTVSGGDSFSSTNPKYIISKGYGSVATANFLFRILGGKIDFTYAYASSQYVSQRSNSSVVTANNWNFISAAHEGSSIKLYLNGSEAASSAAGGSATNASLTTGTSAYIGSEINNQRYFDGSIGAINIYNRALTSDEVARNFNVMRHRFGI
jgi:hypothetical protein